MSEVLVTTNPADYLQLEGVYISPKDPPPFVQEIGFNKIGIFGTTLKGPSGAVEIRSPKQFSKVYGLDRHDAGGVPIDSEVWKALLNKKFGTLVISRVVAADAVKASFTLEDTAGGGGTAIARIDGAWAGAYGNDVRWKVEAATDGDANHWNLRIKYKSDEVLYENLDTSTGNDNLAEIIGTSNERNIDVAKLADGRPNNSVASTDGADADGYTMLGQTVAAYTSVLGSDGTLLATDYTATDGPLDQIASYPGVGALFCASEDGAITAAVNAIMATKASLSADRLFLIHEGELQGASVTPTAVITDVASFRNGRVVYTYNAAWTMDPQIAQEVVTSPVSWMACILANTDVDIHPGEEDTKKLLAGITRLENPSMSRGDKIALRAAGISTLELDEGRPVFISGVVTLLTPGKTEITYRRMRDFIQLSAAKFAKPFVKKKGTITRETLFQKSLEAWLLGLQSQERIVDSFNVDMKGINDDASEAQGLKYIALDVKLISHWLHIVFLTDIGTGTVIEQ